MLPSWWPGLQRGIATAESGPGREGAAFPAPMRTGAEGERSPRDVPHATLL